MATSLAHLSPQRLPIEPGSTMIAGRPSASRVCMWNRLGASRGCSAEVAAADADGDVVVGIEGTSRLVTISQAAVSLSLDVCSVLAGANGCGVFGAQMVSGVLLRGVLISYCSANMSNSFAACSSPFRRWDQRRVNVSPSCNHGACTSASRALAVACA